jgi:hypothetical protein
MTSIDQLVTTIDSRLQVLGDEIAKLEDARQALANTNGAAPSPRPRRRARRKQPAAANTDVLLMGALHKMLAASDGLTTSAIAKQANADPAQVLTLLREAEAAGDARRTGQRRGTRWHAITDDDRIAARAAELAAQSRRARKS